MKVQYQAQTAIKNFSYLLVTASLIVGCQTRQKRSALDQVLPPDRPNVPGPVTAPTETAQTIPTTPPGERGKIGLILGPGGLKTLAHLGVLREFEKANIPIHAVVGLEWGALIAAAYSVKGKTNDAEWQIFKLKKTDLPDKALLSSEMAPVSIRTLTPYLDTVFSNRTSESGDIPFSCPSILLENGKLAWWDRGSYSANLQKCLPFPPMFEANGKWLAGAFRVEEAAQKLREKGANIIVFVNVLARGQILKGRNVRSQDLVEALWWEGIHRLQNSSKAVDWVVGVHTRNYDLMDYDARQSLVLFGQEFGASAAKRISDAHGF